MFSFAQLIVVGTCSTLLTTQTGQTYNATHFKYIIKTAILDGHPYSSPLNTSPMMLPSIQATRHPNGVSSAPPVHVHWEPENVTLFGNRVFTDVIS